MDSFKRNWRFILQRVGVGIGSTLPLQAAALDIAYGASRPPSGLYALFAIVAAVVIILLLWEAVDDHPLPRDLHDGRASPRDGKRDASIERAPVQRRSRTQHMAK